MQQRNLALAFCSIMWFTHIFVSSSLSILLPLITREFSLSYSETGVLITAGLLVFAMMQLPSGYLSSQIGSKAVLIFGIALHSTFNILISAANSYFQFFVLNMMRAVGSGCHLTVATAFISNVFEAKDRGRAIGTHESAVSLAGLVSPVVTLPLALTIEWRATYLIYGVLGILVAAVAYIYLPNIDGPREAQLSRWESGDRGDIRSVLMLLAVMTIHAFVFHATSAFLPLYLSSEQRISLEYLGYYVAVPNVLGLFGRPIGGYLSDRIGRRTMTLISLASLASGILLTTYLGADWLVLSLALLGVGLHTLIPVLFALLMDSLAPSRRALIAGRVNAIRHLIAGLSPTVVGAIADSAGLSTAFLTLALATLANFSLAFRIREKSSP